jgi:hypothetical protein
MTSEDAAGYRRQAKESTADHRRRSAMIATALTLMPRRSQSQHMDGTVRGSWRLMEAPETTTTLRGNGSVAHPFELVTQPRRGPPVVSPLRPHPNEHHDGFRTGVAFYAEDALAFAPTSVTPRLNSRGEIGPQCFDVVGPNGSDIAVVVYAPNASLNAHFPGGGTIQDALSQLWQRALSYGDIDAPSARSGSEQGTSQAKLTLGFGVMAGKGRGIIIINDGEQRTVPNAPHSCTIYSRSPSSFRYPPPPLTLPLTTALQVTRIAAHSSPTESPPFAKKMLWSRCSSASTTTSWQRFRACSRELARSASELSPSQ